MNPLKKSLFITTTTFLMLFLACGGGGSSSSPSPSPGPAPGPSDPTTPVGSGISITVYTTFPSGETTDNAVDVTYDVTPGYSASVSEVSYSINNGAEEYIYLSGENGASQKGTLGNARVMLVPGENSIVFQAKNTAGNTASFTIENQPYYDFGSLPEQASIDSLQDLSDRSGAQYVNNRIVAFAKTGVTASQVEAAVASIGGTIIGQINVLGMYNIQVPLAYTESGLLDLCASLKAEYPDLFENVLLDIIDNPDIEAVSHTNDPWYNQNNEWALTAINAPEVWNEYDEYMRDVKLGVVDNGFRTTHEDLNIPSGNVFNQGIANSYHGTHVIGTIGAIHNNNKGIAGVININRNSLYGYDSFDYSTPDGVKASESALLAGLAWTVTNGVKVVNFSIGASTPQCGSSDPSFGIAMYKLLNESYDFVVVHAAGNDIYDASCNGVFAYVTEEDLRRRIITVSAVDENIDIANFSNYGPIVDVVAPGTMIYSSTSDSDSSYSFGGGTSTAAPHVTGVAGLVWAINPGLTGSQVKEIIVDSAKADGRAVYDSRLTVPAGSRLTYYMVNAKAAADMAVGTKPAPIDVYNISAAPSQIDFGAAQPNYIQPEARTVTITNTSTGTVTLTQPTSIFYDIGALSATTLAPNATATFTIRPTLGLPIDTYDQTITIRGSNGVSATVSVSFAVTTAPTQTYYSISASPSPMDFDAVQAPYAQPAERTVTVTNTGTGSVTLTRPTATNYDIGALSATSLASNATATFTVRPKANLPAGTYNETITISGSNGVSATVSVSFAVTTTPTQTYYSISASPSPMDFDAVQAPYTQPASRTVTVTNTGTGSVTLTLPTSTNYDIGALSAISVAPGSTATFTIRPKANLPSGTYNETITIRNSS